jgi:LysM repeat protein
VQAADIKRANKLYSQVVFPGTTLRLPAGAVVPERAASPAGVAAGEVQYGTAGDSSASEAGASRIYDTAGVWDGEAGFMCLQADSMNSPDGEQGQEGLEKGQEATCTWVGSLFSPEHGSVLSHLAVNLRVVEGEGLAFRVVVCEWDDDDAAASTDGTSPGAWFAPSANMSDAGGSGNVRLDCGQPGRIMFCSDILRVERDGPDDVAYHKLECPLTCCEDSGERDAPSNAARVLAATLSGFGDGLRVEKGQTVLLAISTEGIEQRRAAPEAATAAAAGAATRLARCGGNSSLL